MNKKKFSLKKVLMKLIIIIFILSIALTAFYIINVNPELIKGKPEQIKTFISNIKYKIDNIINKSENTNISLTQDDDFITVAPTDEKIDKNGNIILTGNATEIVYYNQNDERWSNKMYGKNDTIGIYGCGPTTLAMIVSSLTDTNMNPEDMAAWAYNNGQFCAGSGSYHSIIPEGAKSFGLTVNSFTDYTSKGIIQELSTGKIIVALMDKGHFTSGGHFIILRGITLEGKVLIADPQSLENSKTEWDTQIIIDEIKYGAGFGGPMWSIEIPYK